MQHVTSDTSRSVNTKLSSSVDSSASISWLDNFTSSELSRHRRSGEGKDRSTSIGSKLLFQSESLLTSDEASPSTPNDLSGFAKISDEFGTPPNAGVECPLIATMPGSRPQFSLSQMLFVCPTQGTSGGSGVFPLEVTSRTELLSVLPRCARCGLRHSSTSTTQSLDGPSVSLPRPFSQLVAVTSPESARPNESAHVTWQVLHVGSSGDLLADTAARARPRNNGA
mmetsp:Transcript_36048/g.95727  ORF Transcript_36048/g.95727 Transcript_36048/m.95727 type:complete len:225 (+) Transcript_36048:1247-1921(+)